MACRSGSPEPEDTVVFPDWVMLDRIGRTDCHEAIDNDYTAAAAHTSTGNTCYFSFTLAAPPGVSYLNLHWPEGPAANNLPAHLYVLAADDNLVLLRIAIPSQPSYHDVTTDLFVYAAGPSSPPSALRLPPCAEDFVPWRTSTGILRLASADQDHGFIVCDLTVSDDDEDDSNMLATLRVFSSETGNWRIITKRAPQPQDGGEFPKLWSADDVLAFDGRFLCWVDYSSGVVLSDFWKGDSSPDPVLHFVPFPVEWYPLHEDSRRFRSVSVSHGMMRFVHIDHYRHERAFRSDDDWYDHSYWRACRNDDGWDDPIDWHQRACHIALTGASGDGDCSGYYHLDSGEHHESLGS